MNRFVVLISMTLFLSIGGQALSAQEVRKARKFVRQGNRQFNGNELDEANVAYRKALESDSCNVVARYNLSRSMFPAEWLDVKSLSAEARKTMTDGFFKAAEVEEDPLRKSMSYYNAGVVFQRTGELQLAIEAYKEALRQNPNDDEARYNLVVCKRQVKDQPDQQDNQDEQEEDNDKQQQQQQEQKKPQDKQKEDGQDEKEQPKQQDQPPMSKENAEQLLNNVKREEDKTKQRMQRREQHSGQYNEKNW